MNWEIERETSYNKIWVSSGIRLSARIAYFKHRNRYCFVVSPVDAPLLINSAVSFDTLGEAQIAAEMTLNGLESL